MAKKPTRRRNIAIPAPASQSESVSIREISNGYIIERSGTRRGKYYSHQEYSAGRPVITAAAPPRPTKGPPQKPRRSRSAASHREVGYLTQGD